MQVEEIWQENKRWILGVAGGLVLFFILLKLVGSLFDSAGAQRRVTLRVRNVNREEFYDSEDLKQTRRDAQELELELQRVQAAVAFVPDEEFLAEGKADLDSHYDLVSRRVRGDLLDRAMEYSVDIDGAALRWATPVGREEIGYTLVALELLEQAALRLLAAGEVVKSRDPEARGLVAVNYLRIEAAAKRRPARGGRGSGRASAGPARTTEYRLAFDFRADEATTSLFLEKCRSEQPVICLSNTDFTIRSGRNPGDPLAVRGQLLAVTIDDL